MALPRQRLKRQSWQYKSDSILCEAGFYPARNDVHMPCPLGLQSFGHREPFSVTSQIAPWDLEDFDHIAICPNLKQVSKKDPADITQKAEKALSELGTFDFAFWTDVSYSPRNNLSAAACIGFRCDAQAPFKRQHCDTETLLTVRPTGLVAASYTPEVEGLELPLMAIQANPSHFKRKRVIVSTDCQGVLTGLNPLKHPKFGHVDHHDLLQNGTTQLATSSCYCTCSGPHRMLASYQMKKRITQQIPIVVIVFHGILNFNMLFIQQHCERCYDSMKNNVSTIMLLLIHTTQEFDLTFVGPNDPIFVTEHHFLDLFKHYIRDGVSGKLKAAVHLPGN